MDILFIMFKGFAGDIIGGFLFAAIVILLAFLFTEVLRGFVE